MNNLRDLCEKKIFAFSIFDLGTYSKDFYNLPPLIKTARLTALNETCLNAAILVLFELCTFNMYEYM